jgi:hypothetical protein
MPNFAKSKEK